MNQKKSKSRFTQIPYLCKSVYVMMILCSWLLMIPTSAMAEDGANVSMSVDQQIAVTGRVIDHTGEAVIGASVMVEGTTLGTITDIEGNFSLSAPQSGTLVVSFVGYETQKVRVRTGGMTITLKEDAELLDEVVVVGYGTVKRANLTGAVSSVDMADLSDIPATNLASVLMGTMPGVTVGEATGNPLANATIKIRINGSWSGEEPLYVIDGFIRDVEAFNLIDPSEIDNISVLKDAQASVYGVRGAGGVILVTTKKGKEGKTKINYSGSYGFSQGVSMPEMMSAYEQATSLNHLYREQIINGEKDFAMFTDEELSAMKGLDYNWLDMGWKNANNTRHTLNISGGSDKVKYFVGGSYMWSDGNFSNLDVNRFSVRSGVDIGFTKDFKGSFNISFASRDSNMPLNEKDAEPDRMYGTFNNLNRMPRWVAPYINGLPVGNGMTSGDTHPLEIFNSGSYKKSKSMDVAMGARFDYDVKWVKGLRASLQFNYSRGASNGKQLSKPYTTYNFLTNKIPDSEGDATVDGHLIDPSNTVTKMNQITNGDKLYESASFNYSYQLNPSISYNNSFGANDISAMIMYEQSEGGGNNLSLSRSGMIIDGLESMEGFSKDPSGWTTGSGINTLSRRQSFIGRMIYTYAGRYTVEGTARYEASANFPPGKRWGFFPSISGSWRVSEESWFKENVSFMDELKLRASYGRLGNDKLSMSQWSRVYENKSISYLLGTEGKGLNAIAPKNAALIINNVTWEKSDSYNVGLDMRFLKSLFINVDGFYRYTFDILDDGKSVFPQSAGISGDSPKSNYGIQKTWGGELEIGYQKQLSKDWAINVRGNLAYATNKVVKKNQNPGIVGTWKDEEGRIRGGDTGYFVWKGKDGRGDGLARTWQDVYDYIEYLETNMKNHPNYNGTGEIEVLGLTKDKLRPGMLMYQDLGTSLKDQTPDGKIDKLSDNSGDDRIISKFDSSPFNYGFTLGFTWKDLRFDALFSGQFGNMVVFDKGFYETASGGKRQGEFLSATSNQLREWYGNYAVANPENLELVSTNVIYPRLDTNSLRNYRSDFWLRDGHSLRLRTINVSYNLPNQLAKSIGLDALRVFFTGTNLWTIVNPYPYKDAYVGFWTDYPQIRSFNFGVSISL